LVGGFEVERGFVEEVERDGGGAGFFGRRWRMRRAPWSAEKAVNDWNESVGGRFRRMKASVWSVGAGTGAGGGGGGDGDRRGREGELGREGGEVGAR
jgi:hypothetical protein